MQTTLWVCANRFSSIFKGASLALFCLSAVSFGGCSALRVGLGMREPLAKIDVSAMSAKLSKGPGIAPGQKRALIAQFAEPNGKVLVTEGKGGGKIMWKDLAVTGTVVDVNAKGIVSLRADPRYSDRKTGHVTVTAPSHPNLRAELDIPFRYDVAFVANFSEAQAPAEQAARMAWPGPVDLRARWIQTILLLEATAETERMVPTEGTEGRAETRQTFWFARPFIPVNTLCWNSA